MERRCEDLEACIAFNEGVVDSQMQQIVRKLQYDYYTLTFDDRKDCVACYTPHGVQWVERARTEGNPVIGFQCPILRWP
jgi:hypothetical protein